MRNSQKILLLSIKLCMSTEVIWTLSLQSVTDCRTCWLHRQTQVTALSTGNQCVYSNAKWKVNMKKTFFWSSPFETHVGLAAHENKNNHLKNWSGGKKWRNKDIFAENISGYLQEVQNSEETPCIDEWVDLVQSHSDRKEYFWFPYKTEEGIHWKMERMDNPSALQKNYYCEYYYNFLSSCSLPSELWW